MREIAAQDIYQKVYAAVLRLNVYLPLDIKTGLAKALQIESGAAKSVIEHILKNIQIAEKNNLPLCQDTGMLLIFADIGSEIYIKGGNLDEVISSSVAAAYRDGYFRKSVVGDPLKERSNSGNNLPALIYHQIIPGAGLKLSLLAKGFGSENCSSVKMLKPTSSKEEIIESVVEIIRKSGGSPCPPTVLGIGLGGTMDWAARLSKLALLRELDDKHEDPYYEKLEVEILDRINLLGIGPGGVGGKTTSLGVKILTQATHIAGMPLAVTVNCWADRKGKISF